ncbi:two-component system, sensor histidine kinase YcbA [Seinonella peptonophila]|uniref:histidine kinase n=1 Tax=Seinonella peptonophila TaxID=112248 RepID=A0A1M4Z6H6_9BACL|nr:ATP-binding protein [Seinonella peptonophila]SHF13216.1 two-component system, sensor histidine kinase YcbA [Seinonella peptonophila]
MKENRFILVWMLLTVALAGELKFYPFGDSFRISLGTAIFFFFLLWVREVPVILSGFIVGLFVLIFRLVLDLFFSPTVPFSQSFITHAPAFIYYFTFSILFQLTGMKKLIRKPALVGLLGVVIETLTGLTEIAVRYSFSGKPITFFIIDYFLMVAVIRSFFVVGFFNIVQLRQAKLEKEGERKRNEHVLFLISNLYEETVHLKKSIQNAEEITKDCYQLYKSMNDQEDQLSKEELTQSLLQVAGQVHEIKKDNQRIYAGLAKMISDESKTDYMSVEEIGELVISTHQRLAKLLGKEIQFSLQIKGNHPFYHVYHMLSLINNLVVNAVEAIKHQGMIKLEIKKVRQWVEMIVTNDGPGIATKHQEMIFKAGFTTKYDRSGKPSTGIGLSYVQEMTWKLEGDVSFTSQEGETLFRIRLPIKKISRGG